MSSPPLSFPDVPDVGLPENFLAHVVSELENVRSQIQSDHVTLSSAPLSFNQFQCPT